MKKDILSDGFAKAQIELKKAGDDIFRLPDAIRIFLLVYSAQGVMDNGGYRYFFESNWPQNPPYSTFIEAYKAIGCISQAGELERIVSSFPFDNPHLKESDRNSYMDENYDEDKFEIKGWGHKLCGDAEIWDQLKKYYVSNCDLFE